MLSPTHSSRPRLPMAASTWVESVRCLPLALPPATLPTLLQPEIAQATLRSVRQEPTAKFAEHGAIKAAIGQLQAKYILPIDAGAHGIGRLPIGESLSVLHDGDQGQPPWGLGWLPTAQKELGKIVILVQRCEFISHLHPHVALGQDCMRDADGFFWESWDWLGMHGHGLPPCFSDALVLLQ